MNEEKFENGIRKLDSLIGQDGFDTDESSENIEKTEIKYQKVICGHSHSYVICNDRVYAFGSNNYGILGVGPTKGYLSSPTLIFTFLVRKCTD